MCEVDFVQNGSYTINACPYGMHCTPARRMGSSKPIVYGHVERYLCINLVVYKCLLVYMYVCMCVYIFNDDGHNGVSQYICVLVGTDTL